MGKIITGCWDCTYCGTVKISGDLRECPGCGHPRDDDVTFYMDDPKNYAADPDKVSREADWVCEHCNSLNPASATICPSCGAARGSGSPDYFENKERQEAEKARTAQTQAAYSQQTSRAAPKKTKTFIILAVLAAIIALIVFLVIPKQKNIEIASCNWERSVDVEVYTELQESSWDLPAGAYNVTSQRELYGYETVLDHYETRTRQVAEQVFDGYDVSYSYRDLGNGHFEEVENRSPRYRTEYHSETYQEPIYRQDPVYATKYYYYIMRWVTDRTEVTSGTDTEPYFADIKISDTVRTGDTTEEYWIIDSKGKTYHASYDIWKNLHAGQAVNASIQYGNILEIK